MVCLQAKAEDGVGKGKVRLHRCNWIALARGVTRLVHLIDGERGSCPATKRSAVGASKGVAPTSPTGRSDWGGRGPRPVEERGSALDRSRDHDGAALATTPRRAGAPRRIQGSLGPSSGARKRGGMSGIQRGEVRLPRPVLPCHTLPYRVWWQRPLPVGK